MYRLNDIPLINYGITPGQAPLSNIALEGFMDMPKRLGKTFHDWLDEEGVEPYVDADEIFFGSRLVTFYGFLVATGQQDAVLKLREFYDDFGALTDLVDFTTPWGVFNCYLKAEIKAEYLGNGSASIEVVFEQPAVDFPDRTLPTERTIQQYHIDFMPFRAFGAFIEETRGQYDRPELKQANFTSYNEAGYQLTKVGPSKIDLALWFTAVDFTELMTNVEKLHQVLGSPGTKTLNIDDSERESFVVEGFKVRNIRVMDGLAICKVNLELLAAFDGQPITPEYLLDSEGNAILAGAFFVEAPSNTFILSDSNGIKILTNDFNEIIV